MIDSGPFCESRWISNRNSRLTLAVVSTPFFFIATGGSTPKEGRIAFKAALDSCSSSDVEGWRDPSMAFHGLTVTLTATLFQNYPGVSRGVTPFPLIKRH